MYLKKNKGQTLLNKKDIKELAIQLANIHQIAKEYVNNKGVLSFAEKKFFW